MRRFGRHTSPRWSREWQLRRRLVLCRTPRTPSTKVAKVVRAPTVTPREEEGKMETLMTRGEEDKWRTEGRLEKSKQAKTMTMDPRCNDNKARLEDHQISLEVLEVHQTSQGVLRTNLVVHQTNLEVHKDNKVRQEDLQISLEDLEVHQTNLEARQTNLEDHQIKEGLLPKRWIRIQVILMTNLRQKEKLPRKEKRLQKENHLRRESRGLQMEQANGKNKEEG
jgi:hypothetical protein